MILFRTLVLCLGITTLGCSSEDSDGTATDAGAVTFGQLNFSPSETSAVVPQDVALSSVTAPQSELAVDVVEGQLATPGLFLQSNDGDFLSQVAKIKTTLTAETLEDCLAAVPEEFSLAQGNLGHTTCFGPAITGTGGVDIGNGDAGIWWDYSDVSATSGEACSSSVGDNLMNNVGSYSQTAIGFIALVACAARIGELELPTSSGESIDAISAFTDLDTSSRDFSFDSVSITYDGENSAGFPVFSTSITGSLEDVPRSLEKSFSLTVQQVVQSEEFTDYSGAVQYRITEFEDDRDAAISLVYSYGASGLNYRYRQVQISADTSTIFDTVTGEVDDSIYDGGNGWAEVVASVDSSGFGSLAFVWKTTTLLVFNAATETDGTGVAYFGHRDDTTAEVGSEEFYSIQGMACLPINPGITYSEKVQKQVLSLDLDSGIWDLASSKTSFAPTSNCDASGGSSYTGTNDGESKTVSGPLTNDLEDLSDYQSSWTGPTIPTVLLPE